MADLVYFAYGSNMLRERLLARCPQVRLVGRAWLHEHRLTFDKFSATDDSGKGAFEPASGSCLPGVLWHLPACDQAALDHAEGAGRGYERMLAGVIRDDGTAVQALSYRAIDRRPGLQPWDWYLDLVIAGAIQQQLPPSHVQWLRAVSAATDPDTRRPARLQALAALRHAGFGKHRA